MDNDTIEVTEVRRVLNRLMSAHHSEMQRWKDTLNAHRDESDHVLFAKLEIDIAKHQEAWNAVFDVGKALKIKLDG